MFVDSLGHFAEFGPEVGIAGRQLNAENSWRHGRQLANVLHATEFVEPALHQPAQVELDYFLMLGYRRRAVFSLDKLVEFAYCGTRTQQLVEPLVFGVEGLGVQVFWLAVEDGA